MDVTPQISPGHQIVDGYGDHGFTISGRRWDGSVLVFPTRTIAWGVKEVSALVMEDLAEIVATDPRPNILVLGMGPEMALVGRELRAALRDVGIIVEPMSTGAACRTYNVLLSEDRLVAAALIAV